MRKKHFTPFITGLFFMLAFNISNAQAQQASHPNIIFIYIDDMGYSDLSCYGNCEMQTPNIDRLAKEGIRFANFYVGSPVCSPSRVAAVTGGYPARYRINSYIDSKQRNRERDMADYLDPAAPTIAKAMKKAGYATGHFGKWHLGGGRDIDYAPLPQAYGFDESLVAFEGLGDRVLLKDFDKLNTASSRLGHGKITWVKHDWQKTPIFVDRTIDFIKHHQHQPFYVELWTNDVHDPYEPRPESLEKFKRFANNHFKQEYYAVLYDLDLQIGRLLDALDKMELDDNTLIFLAADNGPTDWPRYYRQHFQPPGSADPFRGRKWSLYEGGIREPLLVKWPGHIPAGTEDTSTVLCNIDLLPTLCKLAGAPVPQGKLDGEDMSSAFSGHPQQRSKPLMWVYGYNDHFLFPGNPRFKSPDLAIRDGKWKLLVNHDGTDEQLYNLETDQAETTNVAKKYPDIAKKLSREVINWWQSMPK